MPTQLYVNSTHDPKLKRALEHDPHESYHKWEFGGGVDAYFHRRTIQTIATPRDFFANHLHYTSQQITQWVYILDNNRDQRVAQTYKWIVKQVPYSKSGRRENRAIMMLANAKSNHVSRVSAIIRLENRRGYVFIWRYEGTSVPQLLNKRNVDRDYPSNSSRDRWLGHGAVVNKLWTELHNAVHHQHERGIINVDYYLRNILYHPKKQIFVVIDMSKVYFRYIDGIVAANSKTNLTPNTTVAQAQRLAMIQIKPSLPTEMQEKWQLKINEL